MDNEIFEPLVVLQLSSATPNLTKEWIIRRLTANQWEEKGAGLLVRFDGDPESHNEILLIGATPHRLLLGAEDLQIKKPYRDEGPREFLLADYDQYHNSDNLNNFLTKSEKQRIIWEELQNLHPIEEDVNLPGFVNQPITSKDTILNLLRKSNLLVAVFPLHDKEHMKLIERNWFKSKDAIIKSQDIHEIRNYFGENVAFYFAFLEFYTKALIVPSLLGLWMSFSLNSDFLKYSVFCIFNVIWWSIFFELWKRRSNELAYQWNTWDSKTFERERSQYHSELRHSPLTNQYERYYPTWKRALKKYLITYPFVMSCLGLSLLLFFVYHRIQIRTDRNYPLDISTFLISSKYIRMVPSIGYSLVIIPLNIIYKKLAEYLTDFENHRIQSAYENNLTSKLFLFYFMNCFACLFYEAFINFDFKNVANLLFTFVVFNAIFLKFTEQIGPYLFKRMKKNQLNRRASNDNKLSEAIKQAKTLVPFEGTYNDYLTIFEQYGYVALFSAVFPWVTICALINNIFEIRADAFKYCHVYQRPFAQIAWNIGSWHYAFDILSSVAIVTNTALIAMQPSVRQYFSSYSDAEYILIFVAAEHLLLATKFIIAFAIPDVTKEVGMAKAKSFDESRKALQRERQRQAAEKSILNIKL